MHQSRVPPSTSSMRSFSRLFKRGCARKNGMPTPGTPSGEYHSSDSQKCGRKTKPWWRSSLRSCRMRASSSLSSMRKSRSQIRVSSSFWLDHEAQTYLPFLGLSRRDGFFFLVIGGPPRKAASAGSAARRPRFSNKRRLRGSPPGPADRVGHFRLAGGQRQQR